MEVSRDGRDGSAGVYVRRVRCILHVYDRQREHRIHESVRREATRYDAAAYVVGLGGGDQREAVRYEYGLRVHAALHDYV